jgi:hypothetical protein
MQLDSIYNDIIHSFSKLWKFKVHGETLEIITPFATTSNRFVSLFLSKKKDNYVISDGAWITEGVYDTQYNLKNPCFNKIVLHYYECYEIKQTFKSDGNAIFYKINDNPLAVPSLIMDMANFVSAVISCSEISFDKEEEDEKQYIRFRSTANDFLSTIIKPNQILNTKGYLDDKNRDIKVGAIIVKDSSKLTLINYITGSTPTIFTNSIGRSNLMFEMASDSKFGRQITDKINFVEDTALGYSQQVSDRLNYTLKKNKSVRIDWSVKEKLTETILS